MSIKFDNFLKSNDNLNVIDQKGIFTVFEHVQDLSVGPFDAMREYYMAQMGCTPKQILITLQNNAIRLKPGAMQMMLGDIKQTSNVHGIKDLGSKFINSKKTGDNMIKPLYKGNGYIITEPTYAFPLVIDTREWGGAIVCDDGMFLCCDDELKDTTVRRENVSSALLGGEGLFNLCLEGNGLAVLASRCPRNELYEITLENDIIRIDGNNAVCWSRDLKFSTEKSGKSLIGSSASGEGFVNVFRGTGKLLVAPLHTGGVIASGTQHTNDSRAMGALTTMASMAGAFAKYSGD